MNATDPTHPEGSLILTSSAFLEGEPIPEEYTCDGENLSPPLAWRNAPEKTETLAILVDDPDAPAGSFVHWTVFNIPAGLTRVEEGVPMIPQLPDGLMQGRNSFKKVGYSGPCPPPGKPHRYVFTLYALDRALDLDSNATKKDLLRAMEGHILAEAHLTGLYRR